MKFMCCMHVHLVEQAHHEVHRTDGGPITFVASETGRQKYKSARAVRLVYAESALTGQVVASAPGAPAHGHKVLTPLND